MNNEPRNVQAIGRLPSKERLEKLTESVKANMAVSKDGSTYLYRKGASSEADTPENLHKARMSVFSFDDPNTNPEYLSSSTELPDLDEDLPFRPRSVDDALEELWDMNHQGGWIFREDKIDEVVELYLHVTEEDFLPDGDTLEDYVSDTNWVCDGVLYGRRWKYPLEALLTDKEAIASLEAVLVIMRRLYSTPMLSREEVKSQINALGKAFIASVKVFTHNEA